MMQAKASEPRRRMTLTFAWPSRIEVGGGGLVVVSSDDRIRVIGARILYAPLSRAMEGDALACCWKGVMNEI